MKFGFAACFQMVDLVRREGANFTSSASVCWRGLKGEEEGTGGGAAGGSLLMVELDSDKMVLNR